MAQLFFCCLAGDTIIHTSRILKVSLKGEKRLLFLVQPRLFHSVQASALAMHPYTYMPRTPGCPAWCSPLCRPGSPARTRTGGGGSPAPGPASRMAGHLRCTSCTRHPLLTGTGRRHGQVRVGALEVSNGWILWTQSDTLGRSTGTSGNLRRDLCQGWRFPLKCSNSNSM